jgi:putative addiction module component (TIGR02574 family)
VIRGRILSSVSETIKKLGIDQLDVTQRLALIEGIWESIDLETCMTLQLSDEQRAELEGRMFDEDFYEEDMLELELMEEFAAYSRRTN